MSVSTKTPKEKKEKKEKTESASVSLYTIVNGVDGEGESWKDSADVVSFTSSGAGFYMPRPCGVGNLISLMLPLPAHLRCYDHEDEFYQVWGLVQHCQPSPVDDPETYHIGVAFIGKAPPPSYVGNPLQNYRICGMNGDGLWNVAEAKTRFVARKDVRYWEVIDLYLALIDTRRETIGGERTVTENISRNGAAVISRLGLNVGDRVKFISEKYDFSGLAVVCNRQAGEDGRARLNLEFVENTFPVEKLQKRQNTTD